MSLVQEIYRVTNSFPSHETYGLTNQIRRSAVSVPSNIAEGAARNSKKEFIQFLYISLGSLAEVETQVIIADNLGYIQGSDILLNQITTVRKLVTGLCHYLRKKATT